MGRYVGKPIRRIEDPRLITGRGRYVDDIQLPGMLYAAFVRSPYPHARIRSIDVSDAMRIPGVVAVYTPGRLNSMLKSGIVPEDAFPAAKYVPRLPLAQKARHQGDPVAMVVASDRYVAYDAAERVVVDYEPLEPVLDPEAAMRPNAPLVHEELGSNIALDLPLSGGDVDDALSKAHRVIEETLYDQRVIPAAMEVRGAVASYDGSTLTLWTSTQVPHTVRKYLANILGLPAGRVRVIQPDVGGAFGSKLSIYPEEVAVAAASVALGRPVKWVNTRMEDMLSTNHGRDMRLKYRVGFNNDGVVVAIDGELLVDMGAYHMLIGTLLPIIAAQMLPGPYAIRNIRLHVRGVYTNKVPLDPYRGAGRPEATFFIERIMDLVADETGLDPVEVRLRNFVRPEEMPYRNPISIFTYDTGNYGEALRRGAEVLGYWELLKWAEEERAKGRLIGVGLSFYLEICAFGPLETAKVKVDRSGDLVVATGLTPHGQGDATALAQLVADEFELPIERIRVVWGDTEIIEEGVGTHGSRSVTVGGSAALAAARKLKEELRRAAAKLMDVDPNEVEYSEGVFSHRATGRAVTIVDIANAVYEGRIEANLEASHVYSVESPTFPYGVHVSVVEVDPETGFIKPLLHRVMDDVGAVINPMLAEGQVHGGVVQALGQVLLEEARYNEEGYLTNPNLSEYYVPTILDVPRIEWRISDNPHRSNFLTGTKGIGEAGTIGAPPAMVRAVEMALRPRRVRLRSMPIRPEDVLRFMA